MAQNYYYFVAGLPDLVVDESKNVPGVLDFISEANEQLAPGDMEILRLLLLPFDNYNVITLIDNKNREFDPRGNFDRDTLIAAIKSPDNMPEYLQVFIEAHQEGRSLFGNLGAEDQLNWLFYDQMCGHTNEFIRTWYGCELDLRNVLAGINARKGLEHLDSRATERDRAVSSVVICRNDTAEAILRSTAPDFGLSGSLPWIDRILAASRSSLLEQEQAVDQLRWDMVNELTTFAYFGAESVFAFVIKLLIVERWMKLDAVVGKAKLDRLVEELKSGYTMPVEF